MLTNHVKTIFLVILFLSITVFGQTDSNNPRSGHTKHIYSVVFSPDGKLLVSAGEDKTVYVWDTKSGKIGLKIVASDTVYALAYSPDGKYIAGGTSGKVRLWDAKTGKEIHNSEEDSFGSLSHAMSVAFSPDGKLLAAGNEGEDNEVVVWNVESGEESYRLSKAKSPVAFNKSGTRLATASGDDYIKIWDVETGEKFRTIEGADKVIALQFSPNGKTIMSVGEDSGEQEIKSWSVVTGKQQEEFAPELKPQGGFAFTPDGQSIIVAGKTEIYQELKSLDAETGAEQDKYEPELPDFGDAFALSADGKKLAFSDSSGLNIFILDWEAKEQIAELKGHSIDVKSMAFSRDGKMLIAAYADGSIVQWDAASGNLKKYILPKETNRTVSDKRFLNSDGSFLAANIYNQIDFYNVATGEIVSAEDSSLAFSDALTFSSDSKILAAGGSKDITLFEVSSGRVLKKYAFPAVSKTSAETEYLYPKPVFSNDGKMLAGVAKTGIALWTLTTGKLLRTVQKDFGGIGIEHAAFSADGKLLIISPTSFESYIMAVNVATGATVYKLAARGSDFGISLDGKMLALSASYEKLILANLATGKTLREIKTSGETEIPSFSTPSVIHFSRDNSILAVGGEDGITLYKTATGEKIRSMP